MGRCKDLGSLKFFLWYASNYPGARLSKALACLILFCFIFILNSFQDALSWVTAVGCILTPWRTGWWAMLFVLFFFTWVIKYCTYLIDDCLLPSCGGSKWTECIPVLFSCFDLFHIVVTFQLFSSFPPQKFQPGPSKENHRNSPSFITTN